MIRAHSERKEKHIEITRSGCTESIFQCLHLSTNLMRTISVSMDVINCNVMKLWLEIAIYGVRVAVCSNMVWPLSFRLNNDFHSLSCLVQPGDYAWLVNAQIISCRELALKNGKRFYWTRRLCRVAGCCTYWDFILFGCTCTCTYNSSFQVFWLKPDHTCIAFLRLNRIHIQVCGLHHLSE